MSGSPKTVARPQQATGGPTFMPRPVQGYQAPARTVDYSYKPQQQAQTQIQSPYWAIPQFPVPDGFGEPTQDQIIYDYSTGQQVGGPRFNTDGMYTGTWESGLSDGTQGS